MPSVAFGQTRDGCLNKDPYYCAARCSAVGATLCDGSRLICKAGGVAWFVAPASSAIGVPWANGQYNGVSVGTKCCISEWGVVGDCLSANVLNYVATEWFIPDGAQLANPGQVCKSNWGNPSGCYWSSTESSATSGYAIRLNCGNGVSPCKAFANTVIAFRCVTY